MIEVNEKEYIEKAKNVCVDLKAKSYNQESTLSDNTKLVIVGTLTPPNTKYFYCSYQNRIYGYIDAALEKLDLIGDKKLKDLKIGLSYYQSKRKTIEILQKEDEINKRVQNIKKILSNNGIAFLDVIDKAIRRINTSLDKDIEYYTLATEDFEKLKESGITIIANSRDAEKCAKKMMGEDRVRYLSQRCDTKETWIKAICDAIK